jgi:histidine triad (HIT) family protein
MASIFTQIVQGDIPAAKVYEDDMTLAFMDIRPAARGHTLVICKEEYPRLLDMPPDVLAAVAQTTQKVARAIMTALEPEGFNVVQNDGAAAGQVVFHYHVHIIPRWKGDSPIVHWVQKNPDPASLQTLAQQIKQHL